MDVKATQLIIFTVLFLLVSGLGFAAARWRRPDEMNHLDEWGLGGRSFGGWVTWFLIGGDLYTAYTFVAVPALLYGAGATGLFALPYTVVVYPLVFLVLIRLWSVSHVHGFVTPADFVRARFGSSTMALLVAITGILATMPYIALQLVGLEAVLKAMGVEGKWPITIAFLILAIYTYNSGLRAPALIAFVKDALIYLVIIVAIIVIPYKLGGWDVIFGAAEKKFGASPTAADGVILNANNQINYITLALGSALALFLYPHSITGVLASKNRDVIKRNMSALPAYSLVLGLIALLGYMAIAAKIVPIGADPAKGVAGDRNTVVPLLFDQMFPDWFTGIAHSAVGIGALVPAAIMSIAAANLFTRNIWKEYIRPQADSKEEAQVSKIASLVVKFGAVAFILFLDPQFSIDLQLIGGVVILQTLPAVAVGLYTRWFHRWALVAGWAAGMTAGFLMLYVTQSFGADGKTVLRDHFGSSAFSLAKLGLDTKWTIYAGFVAVAVNLAVVAVLTPILRAGNVAEGVDATRPQDYTADAGDPKVKDIPELVGDGTSST